MPEPTPVEMIREALNLIGLVPDAEDIPRAKDALTALASLEAELAEAREALNAQGDSWWRALESDHWRHQDQALDAAMDMLLAVRVALSRHSPAEEPSEIRRIGGRDVDWRDVERTWQHTGEPPE